LHGDAHRAPGDPHGEALRGAVRRGAGKHPDRRGVTPVTETRYIEYFKEMYFGVGFDSNAPRTMVQLDSVQLCNDYNDGFAGLGCDMAAYHLKDAIADVAPLDVATNELGDQAIGKKFSAIGYGFQNETETTFGTRKAGTLTLRATRGAPLQVLYPNSADYVAALDQTEGAGWVNNNTALVNQLYATSLKEGSEVFAGGAGDDAQVCHGDSGGPLLMKVGGKLVVQGVLSALTIPGTKQKCQGGAVYELPTSSPARKLVDSSLHDPCEGIPSGGHCDGDVAVRCTHPDEGDRRVVRTDCSELLQRCIAPGAPDLDAEAPDAGAAAASEVSCGD